MRLEPEQEHLLARMVEGAREVPRIEREWLQMRVGGGVVFSGPGFEGREEIPEGDTHMLELAGLITAIRYSNRDHNPTFVLTPDALDYYAQTRESEPAARQESELRRFLDSEAFRTVYPQSYAKWAEADSLLWRADSEREFTTIGHKIREALQEFATEAIDHYSPAEVDSNVTLVNRRLGAIIVQFLPQLGDRRASVLKALGDYSEATLALVQRQEHGAQKEGSPLTWQDARSVTFHAASVMYEFAESFAQARRQTDNVAS